MTKNQKIAGLILGTIAITSLAFLSGGKVDVCIPNECLKMTPVEYTQLKQNLFTKIEADEEITMAELELYIKILNMEIQEVEKGGGKFEVKDVSFSKDNPKGMLKKINARLK